MSLSALNSPPLLAMSGVGLTYALPFIDDFAMKSPWSVVRIANLLSYGINVISVSRPGRLDGEAAVEDGQLSPRNGKTLVAPAGWAFAIWGPIFLGEAVGVLSQFFLNDEMAPIVKLLRETSGPFIAAQLFQSMWCATFRKKYDENKMFISVGMLSATAYSLSKAHAAFTSSASSSSSALQYGLFFFPMALHFGWTTAASIVNLNGAVAMKKDANEKVIALVGHLSVIVATILGVVLANKRGAPVYSGVISWALSAVADSMKKRIEGAGSGKDEKKRKNKKGNSQIGLYGASTQYVLSKTGAIANAATSAVITGLLLLSKNTPKSVPPL